MSEMKKKRILNPFNRQQKTLQRYIGQERYRNRLQVCVATSMNSLNKYLKIRSSNVD